jgi:hypothetical protein
MMKDLYIIKMYKIMKTLIHKCFIVNKSVYPYVIIGFLFISTDLICLQLLLCYLKEFQNIYE